MYLLVSKASCGHPPDLATSGISVHWWSAGLKGVVVHVRHLCALVISRSEGCGCPHWASLCIDDQQGWRVWLSMSGISVHWWSAGLKGVVVCVWHLCALMISRAEGCGCLCRHLCVLMISRAEGCGCVCQVSLCIDDQQGWRMWLSTLGISVYWWSAGLKGVVVHLRHLCALMISRAEGWGWGLEDLSERFSVYGDGRATNSVHSQLKDEDSSCTVYLMAAVLISSCVSALMPHSPKYFLWVAFDLLVSPLVSQQWIHWIRLHVPW